MERASLARPTFVVIYAPLFVLVLVLVLVLGLDLFVLLCNTASRNAFIQPVPGSVAKARHSGTRTSTSTRTITYCARNSNVPLITD